MFHVEHRTHSIPKEGSRILSSLSCGARSGHSWTWQMFHVEHEPVVILGEQACLIRGEA